MAVELVVPRSIALRAEQGVRMLEFAHTYPNVDREGLELPAESGEALIVAFADGLDLLNTLGQRSYAPGGRVNFSTDPIPVQGQFESSFRLGGAITMPLSKPDGPASFTIRTASHYPYETAHTVVQLDGNLGENGHVNVNPGSLIVNGRSPSTVVGPHLERLVRYAAVTLPQLNRG